MAVVRIRLCDADRERYDVGDLELDVEALKDLTGEELEVLEREMSMPIAPFVEVFEAGPLSPAWVRRVAAWLAVRLAGGEQSWDEFTPKVLRGEFDRETIPGPPAGPSEGSSEDEAPEDSSAR